VVSAGDGNAGLELFISYKDAIIAILLDVAMPVMDGVEMLKHLRLRNCQTPILMMSGYTEQDFSSRLLNLKPDGFIHKPFLPDDLITRLEMLIKSRRT
jgi:DNA-binding response OmpR family regulator